MKTPENVADFLIELMDLFGGASVFINARYKAMAEMKPAQLESSGLLLGGRLKITWDFDPNNPPEPSPDSYFDLRPLTLGDLLPPTSEK